MKTMEINDTAKWLTERDNFLILSHRRPDGDTLGCAAGLASGLSEMGKSAYIINNPDTTDRYKPFVEKFYPPEGFVPQHIITVDTADISLFPRGAEIYADEVDLSIDHHPSNTFYAQNTCLNGSRAACGEIIYEVLIAAAGKISPETAKLLYIALSTDTGCFSFGNTTGNTFRVAGLLAEAGAPIGPLNKTFFRTKGRGRLTLEGMIFTGLEYYFNGQVCIASITNDMMAQAGVTNSDMDDIAAIPGSVDGVLVGITVRELSGPNDCKVSVRSTPRFDSNALCKRFGGGGHPMAAGCSASLSVAEMKKRLIEELTEFFPLPEEK